MKIPLAHDPLGEALHFLRMSGVFYCRSEFTAPWALDLPPFEDCLMFHVVTSGRCVLDVKGAEDHVLRPGDFALVPHGAGHRLASEPGAHGAKLLDLPREQVSDRYEILRHGGGGARTTVICGVVRFDHPAAGRLLTLLPRVIAVDAWSSPEVEWIQSTLRLMAVEARELRPGGETVITRLADILVIQAIRSVIASDPPPRPDGSARSKTSRLDTRSRSFIVNPRVRGRSSRSPAKSRCPARHLPRALRSWLANRRCTTSGDGGCMSR